MIEYEDSTLTVERALELFGLRDANTFVKELTGLEGHNATEALRNLESNYSRHRVDLAAGFSAELVDSEGGGEGEGEYVSRTWKVTNGGQSWFIGTTGSYYSYDGTHWSGEFTFQEAREVVVTQYIDLT